MIGNAFDSGVAALLNIIEMKVLYKGIDCTVLCPRYVFDGFIYHLRSGYILEVM